MKIISNVVSKGGVGKSCLNYFLGQELSCRKNENDENNRILYIDLDPQANLTSYIHDIVGDELTMKDAILHHLKIEDVIIKNPLETANNIDLIASSVNVSALESVATENITIFLEYFTKNYEYLNENYDYVIIDYGPSPNQINASATLVLDSIVLVSEYSNLFALNGLQDFKALYEYEINKLNLPSARFATVINKYSGVKSNANKLFDDCLDNYPTILDMMLETKIHDSSAFKTALLYRQSMREYAKGKSKTISRANKEVIAYVDELTKKGLL